MKDISTCADLMAYIDEVGFLPLLRMGYQWSAEEVVSEECRYTRLPDGGWEWPLWRWKGEIVQDSGCAYGKFFDRKAGFVSKEWWPDFCNWRRACFPAPEEGSVEGMILQTLKERGSLVTRDLRKACGFTLPKMRSKFDAFITRLEMGCYIVTEDFVYPRDRHGCLHLGRHIYRSHPHAGNVAIHGDSGSLLLPLILWAAPHMGQPRPLAGLPVLSGRSGHHADPSEPTDDTPGLFPFPGHSVRSDG